MRQKLDDELPELTEGLVSMLWPHYLRMIPSLSILEVTPTEGLLQSHEVLVAGLEVLADPIPVDDKRVECVYRTTQAVDLYPLKLTEANAYAREDGRSVIRFRLELQAIPQMAPYFDVEIVLAQPYPEDMRFTAENVRLFCTPIINLFNVEADPITVSQFETEYRVHTVDTSGDFVETYSVESIVGFETSNGTRFEYSPFASFRHRGGMLRHEMPERYFHTRARRGPSGRFDTWVVLGGHAWEGETTLPKETLSLSITGTNGMLPRKGLREASINRTRGGFTNVASVRNLTAPTLPVYPPTGDRFHWRVLSHLAPNYLSLLDAEILRGSLALYDWTDGELNRRRIDAIVDVKHRPLQKLVKGGLLRGVEIEVTLNSDKFAGDGDLVLFGEMLNRFLALYATMNIYTKLVVISLPTGRRITWPDNKAEGAPF
jgi:type VI secretion system protein ImpG